MEKNNSWNEIWKILCKMMFNVFYCSCFLWLAVNLFLLSFSLPWHLTFAQSISICFLFFTIGVVFGIGGNSK